MTDLRPTGGGRCRQDKAARPQLRQRGPAGLFESAPWYVQWSTSRPTLPEGNSRARSAWKSPASPRPGRLSGSRRRLSAWRRRQTESPGGRVTDPLATRTWYPPTEPSRPGSRRELKRDRRISVQPAWPEYARRATRSPPGSAEDPVDRRALCRAGIRANSSSRGRSRPVTDIEESSMTRVLVPAGEVRPKTSLPGPLHRAGNSSSVLRPWKLLLTRSYRWRPHRKRRTCRPIQTVRFPRQRRNSRNRHQCRRHPSFHRRRCC